MCHVSCVACGSIWHQDRHIGEAVVMRVLIDRYADYLLGRFGLDWPGYLIGWLIFMVTVALPMIIILTLPAWWCAAMLLRGG